MFGGVFSGRRVLVTGHTGFKGSWLVLWLQSLGARVTGVALPPETLPSHWELLHLDAESRQVDIRDAVAVQAVVAEARPEIVFHLAAQALVRPSYADPLGTWATNVMGTANVLEACRRVPGVRAIVAVTTDKCYANREWHWAYRETDALGGRDPYSASKAAAEFVVASYRDSFFGSSGGPLAATARAGNVIGGGDWAQDRLVADAARSAASGTTMAVRHPQSTRPWQHVLEAISGYLLVGQRLLEGHARAADAWNFGPSEDGVADVASVLEMLRTHWPELRWQSVQPDGPHEARLLKLDSARARAELQWHPVWSLREAVDATAEWYRLHRSGQICSVEQMERYVAAARLRRATWALS